MNKGRAARGGRISSRTRQRQRGMRFGVYILVFSVVVLALGIGLAVYFSQSRGSSSDTGLQKLVSPTSEAEVGKPAPGFSLPDQYERSYMLTPGDGKNHLLVFYMGNF